MIKELQSYKRSLSHQAMLRVALPTPLPPCQTKAAQDILLQPLLKMKSNLSFLAQITAKEITSTIFSSSQQYPAQFL